MNPTLGNIPTHTLERLTGIVERVTFHNPENGWTVLKVSPFNSPGRLATVLIHQAKVFAGATMEFQGEWNHHPKHGEQFRALTALEKKPASTAAIEKYLGSGLIRGVGPATAKKIVAHFKDHTLDVFEKDIGQLLGVPGIAEKKLDQIKTSWQEHRAIRDVMMFLQGHGISTLFAVKIYKTYGDRAIEIVSQNPYRLAHDIYGIGFFSADKIALKMGFERFGVPRIEAGIKHVLAASREEGHCYLTEGQILRSTRELLQVEEMSDERIQAVLADLLASHQIKCRGLAGADGQIQNCYYSKSIYYDEEKVAQRIKALMSHGVAVDGARVESWVIRYCEKHGIKLSEEQLDAVVGIAGQSFSILTGGPGCGKTTSTRVLVQLLKAMRKRVLLAAPTGRAAQRMSEVIGGVEAKTLHRLLEWAPDKGGFKRDENDPLPCDFLVVDECSMLDISLASCVLRAVPLGCQVLLIGDPDQLPAVGAGDVLNDLLKSDAVARFRLTRIFRQAEASSIIRFAHEINSGIVPRILSPMAEPEAFKRGVDCLFVDSDEATQEQLRFLQRAKAAIGRAHGADERVLLKTGEAWSGQLMKAGDGITVDKLYRPETATESEIRQPVLSIPEKFRHVKLESLAQKEGPIGELLEIFRSVHPWSSLHYGLTAVDAVVRRYIKTVKDWLGPKAEVQINTPQLRGS
ncbi:MAG: AAA family ATPase, partial [Bdellovibrionales bacterium]